ncbi:MAG TPA: glycerophosphodiester phosphodiesterase [Candidatus Eisenbacteria bacterium]|nr:glycerophosphodiester phosphodiesterase [Candidatus Eisenbacteria bacterium]
MKTKIFAHRGASLLAAENTMPAFQLAMDLKADGLELDIQKTKDNQIIVTHDENLKRVTLQDKKIAETTYAEIKTLNAAAFRENDAETHIPLLEEVLDLIKSTDTDMLLNIELKNAEVLYPDLENDTLALVREYDLEERVIFSSFNHYSIMKLLQLGTKAELAFLYLEGLFEPWKYAKMNRIPSLHPFYPNLMIPDYIKSAHEAGIKIRPWTVDQAELMQKLIAGGVDALITNNPKQAVQIRDAIQQ